MRLCAKEGGSAGFRHDEHPGAMRSSIHRRLGGCSSSIGAAPIRRRRARLPQPPSDHKRFGQLVKCCPLHDHHSVRPFCRPRSARRGAAGREASPAAPGRSRWHCAVAPIRPARHRALLHLTDATVRGWCVRFERPGTAPGPAPCSPARPGCSLVAAEVALLGCRFTKDRPPWCCLPSM